MVLTTDQALLIAILCVVGAILAALVLGFLAYYFFYGGGWGEEYYGPWGAYSGEQWMGHGHEHGGCHAPLTTDRRVNGATNTKQH